MTEKCTESLNDIFYMNAFLKQWIQAHLQNSPFVCLYRIQTKQYQGIGTNNFFWCRNSATMKATFLDDWDSLFKILTEKQQPASSLVGAAPAHGRAGNGWSLGAFQPKPFYDFRIHFNTFSFFSFIWNTFAFLKFNEIHFHSSYSRPWGRYFD